MLNVLAAALCRATRRPRARSSAVAFALLLSLVGSFGARPAQATILTDHGPPDFRVVWTNLSALRYNPLGIGTFSTLHFRKRLYKHDSAALRENYLGFGLIAAINPVRTRLGGLIEFSPLTPLRLWVSGEALIWQPILGVRSDPTLFGEFNEDLIQELFANNNTSYGAVGTYVTFGADAQIKIGPVAARAFLKAIRSDVFLKPGDHVFYDANVDVSMPRHGFTFLGDFDLLAVFGPFATGIRTTVTHPLYTTREFGYEPTVAEQLFNINGPNLRTGPLVAYTFFTDDGAILNKPTVAVILQWHLLHRYRAGAYRHTLWAEPFIGVPAPWSIAVPYIAVAFTGFGDLLETKR
jgi:hypothetical protein